MLLRWWSRVFRGSLDLDLPARRMASLAAAPQLLAALPLFHRAAGFADRIAIATPRDGDGVPSTFTYRDLLRNSHELATVLRRRLAAPADADLSETRIAYLTPAAYSYVVCQWAIWGSGALAVPLSPSHPPAEWTYFIQDSGARLLVAHTSFAGALAPVARACNVPLMIVDDAGRVVGADASEDGSTGGVSDRVPRRDQPLALASSRRALLIYTSGTTGRPKGVVFTHCMLESQIASMVGPWGWASSDHAINVLPLHHVHGVVNVVCCALWAGARLTMLPRFSAAAVWHVLQAHPPLTVFMAVPTVYAKLIADFDSVRRHPFFFSSCLVAHGLC